MNNRKLLIYDFNELFEILNEIKNEPWARFELTGISLSDQIVLKSQNNFHQNSSILKINFILFL